MLDVRLNDGTAESFDYNLPKRVTYKPDGRLILCFGEDKITVHGDNLERVRQAVTEGRARSIQEGTEAEQDVKPDDAAHIESIEIVEGEKIYETPNQRGAGGLLANHIGFLLYSDLSVFSSALYNWNKGS